MAGSFLDDLFGLNGQVAVVIGGTGVLGGALALGLARAGAMVVVSDAIPRRGPTASARSRPRADGPPSPRST